MKPTRRLFTLYADYLSRTRDEGLPALSLRNLLHQLVRADERGWATPPWPTPGGYRSNSSAICEGRSAPRPLSGSHPPLPEPGNPQRCAPQAERVASAAG